MREREREREREVKVRTRFFRVSEKTTNLSNFFSLPLENIFQQMFERSTFSFSKLNISVIAVTAFFLIM